MDTSYHLILILFRLSNAILCKTSFDPDEYWQALEVAHRRTFGYGYLTWEWHTQLRSYMFPLMFECLYRVLSLFEGWGFSRMLLVLCPRLVMAVLAYLTDVYTHKVCTLLFGKRTALTCLYLQITSWFLFYAITRTFINCLEVFLLTAIFYVCCTLLIEDYRGRIRSRELRFVIFLSLIGFICYQRPTAALVCAYLYFVVAYLSNLHKTRILVLSLTTSSVVSVVLCATDAILYGEVTLPLINFLILNVVHGIASLYGTHPFHWYITQCLPVFLLNNLPAFLIGTFSVLKNNLRNPLSNKRVLILSIPVFVLLNLAFLTPVPHKEFRYLLPVLPFCHMLAARGIYTLKWYSSNKLVSLIGKILILSPLLQLPVSIYFGFVHQRGAIRLMDYALGHVTQENRVLFLMPCHSTPLYSHLHKNATLHFLECSPPNYEPVDRAAVFYKDPARHTEQLLRANRYDYVFCFSTLSEQIGDVLSRYGFAKSVEIFHTHFPEGRIGSHVHVYKLIDNIASFESVL